jgi:hypothetical protein
MAGNSEGVRKQNANKTPAQRKALARKAGKGNRKTPKTLLTILQDHDFIPEVDGANIPEASKKKIWDMTEQEAEDTLGHELSPSHHMLWEKRRLCMIAEEGGTAGVAALKELKAMRQEVAPLSRKAVLVSFQPVAREIEGA